MPYGHHDDQGLSAIASVASCDVFGLDGSLEFSCSGAIYHGPQQLRDQFSAAVVPLLEKHYGMTAREITWGSYHVGVKSAIKISLSAYFLSIATKTVSYTFVEK